MNTLYRRMVVDGRLLAQSIEQHADGSLTITGHVPSGAYTSRRVGTGAVIELHDTYQKRTRRESRGVKGAPMKK